MLVTRSGLCLGGLDKPRLWAEYSRAMNCGHAIRILLVFSFFTNLAQPVLASDVGAILAAVIAAKGAEAAATAADNDDDDD